MAKKKIRSSDWLPFIPIGIVVLMVVVLVFWRNVDTDDSSDEILDTGQTTLTTVDIHYNNNDNIDDEVPLPDSGDDEISLRQPPKDLQISCDDVAIYSGEFVESGRDEPVTDVAAILVTNKSDKYLDYAKLVYEVDGNEAIFIVSGLNAGKSAWILENKGLKATEDSKFVFVKAVTPAYKDHVVRAPKELEIKFANGMLMVKNITDETLQSVVLYYKVVHTDGNYLGGKTYMVRIDALEPGQSAQTDAGHFKEDWTQIVRVDIIKADNST